MSMVTLKKYLYDSEPELRRVTNLLFSGLVTSPVKIEESEYRNLKSDIQQVEKKLDDDFTPEHLVEAVGAAMQVLEAYNHRTMRFIRQQGIEFQKMVRMMGESLLRISGSSDRSHQAWTDIRINLERARGLEDLQNIKAKLGECLEEVCQESLRQQAEARAAIAELQRHIEMAQSQVTVPADGDPVTGLDGQTGAEAALREAVEGQGRKFVGVLVLDRLQSIQARFGARIVDQVLTEWTRDLKQNLAPGDKLFRWSAPALIVIMPRQLTIDRMRIDVKPVFGKSLEKEFDVGGRNVLIPVSPAWAVFGLVPPVAAVLRQVESFIASQLPKDYV